MANQIQNFDLLILDTAPVVTPPNTVPVILAASIPFAVRGNAYSYQLTANGGAPPYVWSVVSGMLPPGLTLSPTGLLSGTPIGSGRFNFSIQIVDTLGVTATTLVKQHGPPS